MNTDQKEENDVKEGELILANKKEQPSIAYKALAKVDNGISALVCLCVNLVLLPFRLLWNLIVIGGAITLLVIWLGFVFGSVVGVILLLIFMPEGFLLPLALLGLVTPIWKECE